MPEDKAGYGDMYDSFGDKGLFPDHDVTHNERWQ